jgi:hypothetical protein
MANFKLSLLMQTDVAASGPATEVVAKGDFLRFSMNDSLALEAAFLRVSLHRFFHQFCTNRSTSN